MAMKRCSECGEKYSDTYKRCPFCEEEQKISKGKRVQPKRPKGSGRGAKGAPTDKENALTLVLIVIMLVLAGILLWLLFGGGGGKNPGGSGGSSSEISSGSTSGGTSSGTTSGATSSGAGSSSGTSSMPEVIVPELPLVDKVKQLPETLTLNKTDFTEPVGNTVQLKVGSGGGVYSWVSENESIATVDSTGKVTMVGAGTTNVYATDGEHMGKCIVRVKAGSGGTTQQQPTTDPTPSTSSAKISRTDMTIKVGATWRLKITGYDGTVTWKTNDAGVATVSEDGVVRGISSGNTTVTATVGDRTLKCIVRVKN